LSDFPQPQPLFDQPAIPPLPSPPEREPFWGYNDLVLFIGLAPVCMGAGMLLVKAAIFLFHAHPPEVEQLLPAQLLFYLFLFGALAAVFRVGYDRPFWRSLAWRPYRLPFLWSIVFGMVTAILVAVLSSLIRLPDTENEMTQLMESPAGLILMAIFGVTVAPVCEELAFRGFLQPLLVRSMGVALGIAVSSIPFGLLHFWEYGNSWRHALIISGAGAAFGIMRHVTGSTRASALMHAAYNGLFFVALLSDRKILSIPHSW
jgi:membrane protease YdiL (CAAX protease family)